MNYNKEQVLSQLRYCKGVYESIEVGKLAKEYNCIILFGLCNLLRCHTSIFVNEQYKDTACINFLAKFKPPTDHRYGPYWFPTIYNHETKITQGMIDECITPRLTILNQIIKHIEDEV